MDLTPVLLYVRDLDLKEFSLEARFELAKGDTFMSKLFLPVDNIPKDKFYYPIFFNKTELLDNLNSISLDYAVQHSVHQKNCKIIIISRYEGWTWDRYHTLIEFLKDQYGFTNDSFVVLSNNAIGSDTYNSIFFNFWEYFSYSDNPLKEKHLGKSAVFNNTDRQYKFICLNRRCHSHRFAVTAQLYNHRDQSLLSFAKAGHAIYDQFPTFRYFNDQKKMFNQIYQKSAMLWEKLKLDDKVPLTLPSSLDPYDHENLETNPILDEYPEKFYHSYLHIVVETTMSNIFYSEKTFKPIKYFQPFILIGAKGSLLQLRNLGYKTFENYIDESYDEISNNEDRLIQAVNAGLNFVGQTNLSSILQEMYPILEHNHNILNERSRSTRGKLHQDISSMLSI